MPASQVTPAKRLLMMMAKEKSTSTTWLESSSKSASLTGTLNVERQLIKHF